ncbi:MAG: Hpt domain-containing protein [Gammaproteobacteria bacterium]|nr:Hpt domain-containing protein [Gammaproteobacteria bacterium]
MSDNIDSGLVLAEFIELRKKMGDRIYMLRDKFVENTHMLINETEVAINECDIAKLVSNAHTLKGSSAAMSARKLANLAQQLESNATLEDWQHMQLIMSDLKKEFQAVIQNLNRLL